MKQNLILFILLGFSSLCNSQSTNIELSVRMFVEPSTEIVFDSTFYNNPNFEPMGTCDSINVFLIVQLCDTSNVSSLHVKLGTSLGQGNKLTHIFYFDAIPSQTSLGYSREGNKVRLHLGSYPSNQEYFSELQLEDQSGVLSLPFQCHSF
ncbi:MAG: hypothetical protein K9H62_13935 [Bacteroidales bacterium]|nr:hypothetical protein [Bacteroidales bacterium]